MNGIAPAFAPRQKSSAAFWAALLATYTENEIGSDEVFF
jgi:hypothetical protein